MGQKHHKFWLEMTVLSPIPNASMERVWGEIVEIVAYSIIYSPESRHLLFPLPLKLTVYKAGDSLWQLNWICSILTTML